MIPGPATINRWLTDNSAYEPDSIIDYIVINYRIFKDDTIIRPLNGIAALQGIEHDFYKVGKAKVFGDSTYMHASYNAGHALYQIEGSSEWHNQYFLHEFAHNLYEAKHQMGANQVCGFNFYAHRGWGMMTNQSPILRSINSWESYWLGWGNVRTIETSGTYYLHDFVTYGDAIRIRLPYTNTYSELENKYQYLYIENHQFTNQFDSPNENNSLAAKGLYMFIANVRNDCSEPRHRPRNANALKTLSAKGFKDYEIQGNSTACSFSQYPLISFNEKDNNPISGTTDLTFQRFYNGAVIDQVRKIRIDTDPASGQNNDQQAVFVKNFVCADLLDTNIAFRVGDQLNFSSNSILSSYPPGHVTLNEIGLNSRGVQPFILHGLSVRVLSDSDGVISIEVDYNSPALTNNQRFAGAKISLYNFNSEHEYDLDIMDGVTLTINKSGTVNNEQQLDTLTTPHIINSFIEHTKLEVMPSASICLRSGSKLLLDERSRLILKENNKILIKSGAILEVSNGSSIELNNNSTIHVENNGIIKLLNYGKLIFNNDNQILLDGTNSSIILENGGLIEIGNGATFTWTGNG